MQPGRELAHHVPTMTLLQPSLAAAMCKLDKPFQSGLTAPRQIQDANFRSGSCFTWKKHGSVSKSVKSSPKFNKKWLIVGVLLTSRCRFVTMSLIFPGMHAANICSLLFRSCRHWVTWDNYVQTISCACQLVPRPYLQSCMGIVQVSAIRVEAEKSSWKRN